MAEKATSVKDLAGLLHGAWISNYLLSVRFAARRLLLSGGSDGVGNADAAGWREFFAGPLANASPDEVYRAITKRDGRMLTPQQVQKLRECTLSLCFYVAPGQPAPIVYPVEVPFLRSAGAVQALRQELLAERKDYAPFAVSQSTLNNARDDYLNTLHARMQQTVLQYNAVRNAIDQQLQAHLQATRYQGAIVSAMDRINAARKQRRVEAKERALDQLLAQREKEVSAITGRLVDYVEQAFFVLMGMVEVIDYSDPAACRRFATARRASTSTRRPWRSTPVCAAASRR